MFTTKEISQDILKAPPDTVSFNFYNSCNQNQCDLYCNNIEGVSPARVGFLVLLLGVRVQWV